MRSFLFVAALLSVVDELRAFELWVCCPDVGCFSDAPPYNGMPLPKCPEFLLVDAKLYTASNPWDGETFSRTVFPPSFKVGLKTIFITHGFTQSQDVPWMHEMKDAMLKQGDYNVVIFGWRGGSENINYFQSASDTRTAGAEIALLAQKAIDRGLPREYLDCVGHSLGSHVCGYAGQRLKFGKMTGLDPAAIPFENNGIGLNASSADFVQVIHTHGASYIGNLRFCAMKTMGHVDFYPNGGQYQPACEIGIGALERLDLLLEPSLYDYFVKIMSTAGPACHHLRAVYLFTESILTPCFVARYKCSDQFNLPWSCDFTAEETQNMGFNSYLYEARGIFYLTTNDKAPFCQH